MLQSTTFWTKIQPKFNYIRETKLVGVFRDVMYYIKLVSQL